MTVVERKRTAELAVEEAGRARGCHGLVLGPEPRYGRRARPARAGDRRRLHRRPHPAPLLRRAYPGHDLRVLPLHRRAGRHRDRALESAAGLRVPARAGGVPAARRDRQRRRDQVQRAARDVRAAHAPGRRPADRQHLERGGVAGQHRGAGLAGVPLLDAAVPAPDRGRPAHARIHRARNAGRGREGPERARQPRAGPPRAPIDAARRQGGGAPEVLAGAPRTDGRTGATAVAWPHRGRACGHAGGVRELRFAARSRARRRGRQVSDPGACTLERWRNDGVARRRFACLFLALRRTPSRQRRRSTSRSCRRRPMRCRRC